MTKAQIEQLGDNVVLPMLKQGEHPTAIEAAIKDWLRELPDGLLAAHNWQVDELAELLTLAAVLAAVVSAKRHSL